jgi:hypothetical protein
MVQELEILDTPIILPDLMTPAEIDEQIALLKYDFDDIAPRTKRTLGKTSTAPERSTEI